MVTKYEREREGERERKREWRLARYRIYERKYGRNLIADTLFVKR